MMTFRRILVATDFSEAARSAARVALRFAQRGTKFRLLHVVEPHGVMAARHTVVATLPQFDADREQVARNALGSLARVLDLPRDAAIVRSGRVARDVAKESAAFDADLLVVGARGQTRLQRLLLGSRARSILRAPNTSVLVAREGTPRKRGAGLFQRIGVFTDLHEPSVAAAKTALALADEMGAEVLLVHVLDPTPLGSYLSVPPEVVLPSPGSAASARAVEAAVRKLLAEFNKTHLRGEARAILVRGQASAAGPRAASRERVDLVVVGTHGRGRVGRALIGSVAEALAERSPCSVLIAR